MAVGLGFKPNNWELSLEAGILAWSWDFGLEAGIWDLGLRYRSWDWDLGIGARIWAWRLEFGPGGRMLGYVSARGGGM